MNIRIPTIVAIALAILLLAVLLVAFGYGFAVARYGLYPYEAVEKVEEALKWTWERRPGSEPWFYRPTDRSETVYLYGNDVAPEGLNLVSAIGPNDTLALKVVDMAGELVHAWAVDWFEIWPDATHLPPESVPKTRPGTHLHGTWLLPDGDVLFNFEKHGMVRMGLCGEVVWRLPYQTHHSIFVDDDGYIWASGLRWHTSPLPDYPAHLVPVREQTILRIDQDGRIVDEISVYDLLAENGQRAYLHMMASARTNQVSGDSLHLNDVEVFSRSMEEGFFEHGDVMISLRNIHSVIVFDPDTRKIKLIKTGGFVRQHDPDFLDGDTVAVFDNNHIGPARFGQQSRILLLDAPSGELRTWYEGSEAEPFYTHIMGKHQWLEDGHVLVTDSMNGRGFEIDRDGRIVWEYINLVDDGIVGMVEEVQRLPGRFSEVFDHAAAACGDAE